jgi:hypothetical protein
MKSQTHLKTFRLWLEPDKEIPQFRRLRWEVVKVSIRDVLLKGVHPWIGINGGNSDVHSSLSEAFLHRVNQKEFGIEALQSFGYCDDASVPYNCVWNKNSRFEATLEAIRDEICFVDELTYAGLLEIAKARLRETWTHTIAMELAKAAHGGFQDLRQFLKKKDKSLKLSGYEDLEQYDLSRVLKLEDFEARDSLIISHGVHTLNFRSASFLKSITDEQGRLRLVPEIRDVTLTESVTGPDYAHVVWHVTRAGSAFRFRPDLANGNNKRGCAMEFASRWRTDNGRLCFTTNVERLVEMVETGLATPSFPSLNYNNPQEGPAATALVEPSNVCVFHIGAFCAQKSTGGQLKEIMRRYGIPMTGTKDQLLGKLAKLAAEKYRESNDPLNTYFTRNRYVRIQSSPPKLNEFPILNDLAYLRNLVLTMYVAKHLRGNAVLDPTHENNTYSEEELALALLTGKVSLTGAFLRIA